MNARTKARSEEAYRDIADKLELPGRHDPKVDVLQLVRNWLCNESNGQWTIILDEADDTDVLYSKRIRTEDESSATASGSLATYLPQSCNGSILITSRNMNTATRLVGSYGSIKKVHTMDESQGLQLLRNNLQAAAIINRHAPRMTISRYLDKLRKNEKIENLLN